MKIKAVRFVMVMVFLVIAIGLGITVGRWESTSAATLAAFPLGTYTTELTRADIPAAVPAQFVPNLVGRWETTFAEGGRHTVFKDGQLVIEGRYAATQNQIVLYQDKGPFACDIQERDPRPFVPPGATAGPHSGVYNWTFDGQRLTFTRVFDDCGGRILFFTAHPLAKR
jgi:hypothetical protein